MRIFSMILSLIAFIGSLYSYIKTSKTIAKIDELDNAIFQWMDDAYTGKCGKENNEDNT